MSTKGSFVLREREIMRDRIAKKLGSVVKTEKRSSVLKRERILFWRGILCGLVGRISRSWFTVAVHCKNLCKCVRMVRVEL